MVTDQFWWLFGDINIDHLHFLLSRSEMECTIALPIHALIAKLIALRHVKIW